MHALFIPFVTLLFAASSLTIANAASAGGSQVNCVTQGDGDLYGKGVRIGLYLQWLSTFLLRQLGSWELKERLRTGTNIICGAIMLTAALSILNDRASTIDYLLVYYLTVVLFLSDSFRMNRGAPDIAEIVQPAIFAAFSFFGGWFLPKGIDRLQATTCEEKVAIIWVFNMRGKWTVAASMLSIFAGMAACSISGTSAKQSHLGGFLAPFPAVEIASDQTIYLSEILRYGIFWSDRDTNPILLEVDAMPDNESFVQVIRRCLDNDFLVATALIFKECCNACVRIHISSAEERKKSRSQNLSKSVSDPRILGIFRPHDIPSAYCHHLRRTNVACQQGRDSPHQNIYWANAFALDRDFQFSHGDGGDMGVVERSIRHILGRYTKEGQPSLY